MCGALMCMRETVHMFMKIDYKILVRVRILPIFGFIRSE